MGAEQAGLVRLAGRNVPRLGYGTMRLTGPRSFGPPADRDEAVRVLRRAVELGVRVIDTAWYYGPYVAEEILAEALHPYPEDLVIITKLGGARRDDASWYAALTPEELRAGCENDRRLLRVEAVPVAHLRWIDNPVVSFAEALEAMLELRDEGKVEHVGLSNVDEGQLEAALGRTGVATVSNAYSVLDRSHDRLVERCRQEQIPFLPYFPLGASPVRDGAGVAGADAVSAVAQRLAVSTTQVAIAWLLARSPLMLPIPGTSRISHLEDNLAAAAVELSEGDLVRLDAAA